PLDAGSALAAGRLAFAEARPGTHNGFKIELGARAVADALEIAGSRA
ncbi:xanthine dehydrogenase family protein subunit M, partial [Burkholderia sp. Ap-962]|nr:xanthine dehydrogenase family protein subunit M [Burkholderia sp. Ap-962]